MSWTDILYIYVRYFYIYLSALFSGAPSHLASAQFRLLRHRTVCRVVGLHFEWCAPVSLAAADRGHWPASVARITGLVLQDAGFSCLGKD